MKWFAAAAFALMVIVATRAAVQPKNTLVDRGSYIVNRVAMCVDCHNETLPNGMPNEKKVLSGAPIGFKPIQPVPNWGTYAPNLTPGGFLKNWTDAQLTTFLSTGKDPRGNTAPPPMPPYRMNKADVAAVTAYLRNLPAVESQPRTQK